MNLSPLSPVGACVQSTEPDASLTDLPIAEVHRLIERHRLVVFRGFAPLLDDAFPAYCARLGDILEWDFGAVNDLRFRPEQKNYIYLGGEVPLHWDGAFVGKVPRYIVFHCDQAGPEGQGGETIFTDTTRVIASTPSNLLRQWESVQVTYETEKIVHYGGRFTSPMFATHPATGERILRFAEPVTGANPVRLTVHGLPPSEHEGFIADLHRRLHNPAVCYGHTWRVGDILVADNFALLHGRRAFVGDAAMRRAIRRVNVL